MPEVKAFQSPWEAAQALVADHAKAKYGIADADALKLVTDIAFGREGELDAELRLHAAKVLLKYTRPEVRAIQMQVQGTVDVEHTHRSAAAVAKATDLLSFLGRKKYQAGDVQDGEVLPAAPQDVASEPLKH